MRDVSVAGVYKRIQRSFASRHCCARQWRPRANNARPCVRLARKKRNARPRESEPCKSFLPEFQQDVFTWAQTHMLHTHAERGENEQRVLCLWNCQGTFSTEAKGATGGSAPLHESQRGEQPPPRLLLPAFWRRSRPTTTSHKPHFN